MTFWVYILRCSDNSYYTGHTDNLEKRIGVFSNHFISTLYLQSLELRVSGCN
jgi:putative endonuclease